MKNEFKFQDDFVYSYWETKKIYKDYIVPPV